MLHKLFLRLWQYFTENKMKPWFLYHLDNQGVILDKIDLDLYKTDWVNNNNKAIFPKMGKGDSVVATQNDMPIGVSNWETTLCCPKCLKYHYKYLSCTK